MRAGVAPVVLPLLITQFACATAAQNQVRDAVTTTLSDSLLSKQVKESLLVPQSFGRLRAIVTFESSGFVLSVAANCRAQLRDTLTGRVGSEVPFAELFNPVSARREVNLEACAAASLVAPNTLRLSAAHGGGSVDVHVAADFTAPYLVLTVVRVVLVPHVAFGEFWRGLVGDAPLVMGRMQGPRSLASGAAAGPDHSRSAGFVTITRGGYYKYLFDVTDDAREAVGFVYGPTDSVDESWQALGRARGIWAAPGVEQPGAFKAWYWAAATELDVGTHIARAHSLGCTLLMLVGAVDPRTWQFNTSAFPSGINRSLSLIKESGLRVGLHTLPYPPQECVGACARANLVPEGLAPTYRSGSIGHSRLGHWYYTEDLGSWWGHDAVGSVAQNGNPRRNQYGWECPQMVRYNCTRWGSNMSLHGTHWADAGDYRAGGSIGFNGSSTSYGLLQQTSKFGDLIASGLRGATGLTLGLVLHHDQPTAPSLLGPQNQSGGRATLASLQGSFSLEYEIVLAEPQGAAACWRLQWVVNSTCGVVRAASACMPYTRGIGVPVKATFNGSSCREPPGWAQALTANGVRVPHNRIWGAGIPRGLVRAGLVPRCDSAVRERGPVVNISSQSRHVKLLALQAPCCSFTTRWSSRNDPPSRRSTPAEAFTWAAGC